MSGFVGILNLDGAPVDRLLLERMTQALAFRGPDGQQIWIHKAIGFGHTLLRATCDAGSEPQPAELDSRLWIVADARIDAREDLVAELNSGPSKGCAASMATPDAELILHAYDRWGEACLDHLLGDFAFAIWDERKGKLFSARDHLGVKPLCYARVENTLLVSNTLEVLRLHPGVSSNLSDLAIGDFLLFGINLRADQSAFEDIKKLPPAHLLSVSGHEIRLRRYWSVPIEEPLRYRRDQDYIEQFRSLLGAAVADRLRTDRASVSMSGGLDSPTVAAAAAKALEGRGSLQAVTIVHDEVIPDEERRYAGSIAKHLNIPIHFLVVERYKLFERCEAEALLFPEPNLLELAAVSDDRYRMAAEHSRVLLTGEGGDPGLSPSLSFYRGARVFGLFGGVAKYFVHHARLPRLGFRLAWLKWRGIPTSELPAYPEWLEPAFEARAHLADRWHEMMAELTSVHPDRPRAHALLSQTYWSAAFEDYDAFSGRVQLEIRHPLLDLRMVRFLLRLPVLPWCADKELFRVAMRGDLPQEVLERPKTPLAANPAIGLVRRQDLSRLTSFAPAPGFNDFVEHSRIPVLTEASDPSVHFRAISLNYWLQTLPLLMYKCSA